jgi:hypothetical protein
MTRIDLVTLESALKAAFEVAIKKVGLAAFKATSLFGSNEAKANRQSKAA